ncbi:TetR/AcrR family transcriptional regulator [Flaviflagellibacter deserti]|uniref:TetR/AcrR family transcriptional regulator n=1 Tax=Flaviflagellibacter deserti TaxID=2267266 RepID=A0ABV9Z3X0_9HYPH
MMKTTTPDSLATDAPAKARGSARKADSNRPKRNGAVTRQRILDVAMSEFADHGYSGSRIDRISASAGVNVGMIYHYFSNKDDLYLAALEACYKVIRDRERTLDVNEGDPISAMRQLIELTFDFLSTDPYFVRLIMSENLMMGRIAQRSATIPVMTQPLLDSLRTILKRGQAERLFHKDIDAENFYVSILGLCFVHVSNRYTLSSMFQHDFADPEWLKQRKGVVTDILISYLRGSEV